MRHLALLTLAALSLAACGDNNGPYLPDGGRARINCTDNNVKVPVTVYDRLGNPAPGAIVNVNYLSYDASEDVVANGSGVVTIGEKYGPGVVRVQAIVNDLTSQTAEITFVGGTCSTSVTPRDVKLQLN